MVRMQTLTAEMIPSLQLHMAEQTLTRKLKVSAAIHMMGGGESGQSHLTCNPGLLFKRLA